MSRSHRALSNSRRPTERKQHRRRARLERLEDRRLLAVLTVQTDDDVFDPFDGATSLREAVFVANIIPGPDEIVFDIDHDGPATIRLEHGELEITEALTITGDGPELLTIDAQQQSRIFNFTSALDDLTIAGMTLTGGQTVGQIEEITDWDDITIQESSGGAIYSASSGVLSIENSVISGNSVLGDTGWLVDNRGGGIFAAGDVKLTSSTVSDNSAVGVGGGIRAEGDVLVADSTIAQNSTTGTFKYSGSSGGGISAGGDVTVTGSEISGNTAQGSGGGIFAGGDTLVTDSALLGNSAGGSFGGGIAANNNKVTVVSSTISGNSVVGSGGAISAGSVTVISTTVLDNTADVIHTVGCGCNGCSKPPEALGGGGIRTTEDLTIQDSIIAGNTSPTSADDLAIAPELTTHSGTLVVVNSVIGDNGGTSLTEARVGSPDAWGNLIGGSVHGSILVAAIDEGGELLDQVISGGAGMGAMQFDQGTRSTGDIDRDDQAPIIRHYSMK